MIRREILRDDFWTYESGSTVPVIYGNNGGSTFPLTHCQIWQNLNRQMTPRKLPKHLAAKYASELAALKTHRGFWFDHNSASTTERVSRYLRQKLVSAVKRR